MAEVGGVGLPRQLPLSIALRDEATLENFFVAKPARPLINALQSQLGVDGEPSLYLHGPAGSGKSHLLQSCCHDEGAPSLYLPLLALREFDPAEVLQDIESMARVCLDDLDAVVGNSAWELALFTLCNRARESGCRLVFAANSAPRALGLQLPDLESRLSWGIVFQLPRASDEEKAALLRFRAARRGLTLREDGAAYIVSRAPRDTAQLLALLDELDEASLREKRPLSIPFIRQTLGWQSPQSG